VNGIHEVTGSIPVWSTILSDSSETTERQVFNRFDRANSRSRKPLIPNDLHFRTKLGSNRCAPIRPDDAL
jgi:hypothetical protein